MSVLTLVGCGQSWIKLLRVSGKTWKSFWGIVESVSGLFCEWKQMTGALLDFQPGDSLWILNSWLYLSKKVQDDGLIIKRRKCAFTCNHQINTCSQAENWDRLVSSKDPDYICHLPICSVKHVPTHSWTLRLVLHWCCFSFCSSNVPKIPGKLWYSKDWWFS